MAYELKLFTGNANRPLAEEIAQYLRVPMSDAEVTRFSDGEIYVQVNENVRGKDVFLIQPPCPPPPPPGSSPPPGGRRPCGSRSSSRPTPAAWSGRARSPSA